jgi:hypothetical protein
VLSHSETRLLERHLLDREVAKESGAETDGHGTKAVALDKDPGIGEDHPAGVVEVEQELARRLTVEERFADEPELSALHCSP